MDVIVGSTNTDGTGSSVNLSEDNGYLVDVPSVDSDDYYYEFSLDNGLYISRDLILSGGYDYTLVSNTSIWNTTGLKEVEIIDNDSWLLRVYDFVDVNVEGGAMNLSIIDAKRGVIDTSSDTAGGGSIITINPYSNGDSWSNLFEVTTGSGRDKVYFGESTVFFDTSGETDPTSRWTEFEVDLGDGDDYFYYNLNKEASSDQTRYVDGGDGYDRLYIYQESDVLQFENFEYVSGVSVTLDAWLLEHNSSADAGLTVYTNEVYLSDEVDSVSIVEGATDSSLDTVTVNIGDDSYTLLMDSEDLVFDGEYV